MIVRDSNRGAVARRSLFGRQCGPLFLEFSAYRILPGLLGHVHLGHGFIHGLPNAINLRLQRRQPRILFRRCRAHFRNRVAIAPIDTLFADGVEIGEHLVVLGLGDGIVFVIMALDTGHGQPQPDRARRLDPIHHILSAVLFSDNPAFEINHVIAIKATRKFLVFGGVGEQVPRELLYREFVKGLVLFVGPDDPVPPRPHIPLIIDVVPVGVGIARRVEPGPRHVLGMFIRCQELFYETIVGIRGLVSQEGIHLGDGRRQSG